MSRLVVLVVIVVSASVGCAAPGPVVRVHPTAANVVWHSGRAIVARQAHDLNVAVAYERMDEDRLVFRVEVRNHRGTAREIGPHQIVYRACRPAEPCRPLTAVVDPEATLLALDVDRARTRASQTNHASLGGALLMLNTMATLGAAASGKGRETAELAGEGALMAESTSHSIERHDRQIAVIEAEKVNWASAALRRTTLGPGQGIAGFVHVPLDPGATRVWLGISAETPTIWFEFEQVLVAGAHERPRRQGYSP